MSYYKKREEDLFSKARDTMHNLINLDGTAPINRRIIKDIAVLEWHLKQKYRGEGVAYYVSKSSYEADMDRIMALESKIMQGGAFDSEALEAVKDAKEYLELIAGYRVKDTAKTRVY